MPEPSELAQHFGTFLPHCKALNMRMDLLEDAKAIMSMPYDKRLIGDPETGVIHGGAVSALMDTCGGASVFMHPDNAGPSVTLDLRIDYMRPAKPDERISAEAHCFHVTRTVAFVRVVAWAGDNKDAPVATATGAFSFQHKTKRRA
ncbi:MAG: PaaI family thioesterase [Proteobacteria bacterium]|nr:PaaI family thioesterase [Pseudomonadota bacterium]